MIKTKSGFIVRSVETGLRRWTLVVFMISVDAYPFLAFSDLTCHLEDTGMEVFWLHCPPDSKETELGSSNQEASGKNTRIVLVLFCTWKCAPAAISSGVNDSKVCECHLLWQISSQWGLQKKLKGIRIRRLPVQTPLVPRPGLVGS